MTEPWELPEGWEWANFQEVAQIASDLVSPADHQDEPHIAPNHIESGSGRLLAYTTIAADKVTSPKHRFRPGQILYSKIRPYLCKAVRVDFAGLCSADMYPIAAKIDAGYLHRWMLSLTFTEWASGAQGRTVLPKINQEALSVIQVPVPPLAEQRRIVGKIEELTARSRAARMALAEVPTLLDQFRQSVLASAFRGDLTADWRTKNPDSEPASVLLERIRTERRKQWEAKYPKKKYTEPAPVDDTDLPELPEGWCWVRFGDVIAELRNGIGTKPEFEPPGHPILRINAVRPGCVLFDDFRYLRGEYDTSYLLTDGDILFTRYNGSLELLGVCGVVRGLGSQQLLYPDKLMRVRIGHTGLLPEYVESFFSTPQVRQRIELKARSSAGQQGISGQDIKDQFIAIPPLEEQREITRLVAQALVAVERNRLLVSETMTDLDACEQSILAKAFRGELVPQDPADEPAAALLARLRSGGTAGTPTTPTLSAKRGQVKAYILLLLRTWRKPLNREMLERSLVLMLNSDVRRAIIGRSKPVAKRTKKSGPPPQFVSGMDALLGEMLDDGQIVLGTEAGFFAEGQHGIDFTAAPPSDLDAVRETAEAMKVLHKDKQQATDADIVSALNGEIYELVS